MYAKRIILNIGQIVHQRSKGYMKRYNLDPVITKGDCTVKLNLTEDKEYGVYVKYNEAQQQIKALIAQNEQQYKTIEKMQAESRDYQEQIADLYINNGYIK